MPGEPVLEPWKPGPSAPSRPSPFCPFLFSAFNLRRPRGSAGRRRDLQVDDIRAPCVRKIPRKFPKVRVLKPFGLSQKAFCLFASWPLALGALGALQALGFEAPHLRGDDASLCFRMEAQPGPWGADGR